VSKWAARVMVSAVLMACASAPAPKAKPERQPAVTSATPSAPLPRPREEVEVEVQVAVMRYGMPQFPIRPIDIGALVPRLPASARASVRALLDFHKKQPWAKWEAADDHSAVEIERWTKALDKRVVLYRAARDDLRGAIGPIDQGDPTAAYVLALLAQRAPFLREPSRPQPYDVIAEGSHREQDLYWEIPQLFLRALAMPAKELDEARRRALELHVERRERSDFAEPAGNAELRDAAVALAALPAADPVARGEVLYLLGLAHTLAGERAEAMAAFEASADSLRWEAGNREALALAYGARLLHAYRAGDCETVVRVLELATLKTEHAGWSLGLSLYGAEELGGDCLWMDPSLVASTKSPEAAAKLQMQIGLRQLAIGNRRAGLAAVDRAVAQHPLEAIVQLRDQFLPEKEHTEPVTLAMRVYQALRVSGESMDARTMRSYPAGRWVLAALGLRSIDPYESAAVSTRESEGVLYVEQLASICINRELDAVRREGVKAEEEVRLTFELEIGEEEKLESATASPDGPIARCLSTLARKLPPGGPARRLRAQVVATM
jgi:hypothetical protein